MFRVATLAACLTLALPAAAQKTVTTPLRGSADPQLGSRFRQDANAVARDARNGDLAGARKRLAPILDYCDKLATPTRDVVSVANAAEYEAYMATYTGGKPVEWVDIACPSSYKMGAFLAVEDRDIDSALAFLDKASAMAPYVADNHAERGYVLMNRLRRPEEARASYERALELTQRYPSNLHAKPLILRGLGYVWIELGDLERAEQMYRQSLELDPGNSTALGELEYIREQRARTR